MDLEDATLSNQIMNKYDSIKALEILAEGLTSARDLHDRIEMCLLKVRMAFVYQQSIKQKDLKQIMFIFYAKR